MARSRIGVPLSSRVCVPCNFEAVSFGCALTLMHPFKSLYPPCLEGSWGGRGKVYRTVSWACQMLF